MTTKLDDNGTDTTKIRTAAAFDKMLAALQVVTLNGRILAFLEANDPKALAQVRAAIVAALGYDPTATYVAAQEDR